MQFDLIIIAFCLSSLPLSAQQNECRQISRSVDTKAQYKNGSIDLTKFAINTLAPIIAPDSAGIEPIIFTLHVILTVNKKGQVVEAGLIRFPGTPEKEKKLKVALLSMQGWRPAKIRGHPVCFNFDWPISCFLWENE